MANNGKARNELTPVQVKAIASLLSESNIDAAAKASGVAYRTLYRWVNEDALFQAELRRHEGRLIDAAVRSLARLQEKAVAALEAALEDGAAPHSVKLRAADIALGTLLKLREARTLEDRVAALEDQLLNGGSTHDSD